MTKDEENRVMDNIQEIKDYVKQNQLKKVIFGGYNKEDVQMKFDMILAMVEKYAKEQAEKEAAMLADFEEQIKPLKDDFENQKKVSDILIVNLNKDIAVLTEEKRSMEQTQLELKKENSVLAEEKQFVELEQQKLQEANNALVAENQTIEQEQHKFQETNAALTAENHLMVHEQYKKKEAYKAYCGEILKKYSESLGTLSGEFERLLENVSNMQKSMSEESVIEGLEKALEMMGDK